MIADAVEAASRTLVEPTRPKIRAMIQTIVDDCLRDGQFDECDLTMRDLAMIVDALERTVDDHLSPPDRLPGLRLQSGTDPAQSGNGAGLRRRGVGRATDRAPAGVTRMLLRPGRRARRIWTSKSARALRELRRRRASAGCSAASAARRATARARSRSFSAETGSWPVSTGAGGGRTVRPTSSRFPREAVAAGFLGDIVISIPYAARQARSRGESRTREIDRLLVHGYLHLLGYDHETDDGEMEALEAGCESGSGSPKSTGGAR